MSAGLAGHAAPAPWTFEPVLAMAIEGPLDGPEWVADGLLVCRPAANEILRVDVNAGTTERFRHSAAGAKGLAVGPDRRLYAAQSSSRRVVWLDEDGGTYYLNAMLDGARHDEPQDLVVDRAGRIWFTDDWTDASAKGPVGFPWLEPRAVLRLTKVRDTDDRIGEWALDRVTGGVTHPAGIGLSPDQATLYVADRGEPATLRAFDVRDGAATGSLVAHAFEPGEMPGGLTVLSSGTVLVAVAGPAADCGALVAIGSDGSVERHPIGAVPTNATLGGPDGRTIYVTTATGQILRVVPAEAS